MLPVLIGAGVAAGSITVTAFGAMRPKSQLFGATFYRGSDDRQIALTYDDGPNTKETLLLLEVLAKYSARATFFVIGKYVKAEPAITREILRQGHTLGNHTWSHPNLFWTAPQKVRQELEQCQRAIEDATGESPVLFRPPFGARRPDVLGTANQLNLIPVMWTALCFDWRATQAEKVFARAGRDIEKKGFGSVVLLHDGGHLAMGSDRSHTVKGTELLLKKYREQGYQFVGVDQMMPR